MATQFNIPAPRKAEKKKVKLKLAIQGPSGSGKTWGALALATNLWPGARICVVDAENGSAELYADHFEFDTIPLAPPFHTDRYVACIDMAVREKYDVLIIDQISHQWDGEGGILRRKEELDRRPGANSYTNWALFTPEHERFKSAIVQAPIHIIATMRSKQDYILVTNDKGKQQPQKVGMASVQREGFDYEFTLAFDLQMDHRGTTIKDRTGLFNEKVVDLALPKVAESIREWLNKGTEVKSETGPTLVPPPVQPLPMSYNMGQLVCYPSDSALRYSKDNKPFIAVKINGICEGKNIAFCWEPQLYDALKTCAGKRTQLQVELKDNVLLITDLDYIDGVEYRDGQPYIEPREDAEDALEITDDDIPL